MQSFIKKASMNNLNTIIDELAKNFAKLMAD